MNRMQKSIILLFFFLAVWFPRAFSQENARGNQTAKKKNSSIIDF